MRINYVGNVGIGTSSPEAQLHVKQSGDPYVAIFENTGDTSASGGIKVIAGGNASGAILDSYTYDGSAKTFQGGIRVSNGVIYFDNLSDARFKENIRETEKDGRDIVGRIKVYDYRYINQTEEHTGMLAQEMAVVYPEAVGTHFEREIIETVVPTVIPAGTRIGERVTTTTEVIDQITTSSVVVDEIMTIDYSKLVPVAIRAIQQQQAEIESLKASLEAAGIALDESGAWTPSDAALEEILAALLAELEEDPWTEIPREEALELVAETVAVDVPTSVTKYRVNAQSGLLESYVTTEMVSENRLTGRQVYQLIDGARLDEATGKFYIRQAADGAAGGLASALREALNNGALLARGDASRQALKKAIAASEKSLKILRESVIDTALAATP